MVPFFGDICPFLGEYSYSLPRFLFFVGCGGFNDYVNDYCNKCKWSFLMIAEVAI